MSLFLNTDQRFRNCREPVIKSVSVGSEPIIEFLQATREFFDKFERGSPDQGEMIRKLWWLRTTVLFTNRPFDDNVIMLHEQFDSFSKDANRFPDLAEGLNNLEIAIESLLHSPRNPKGEWLDVYSRSINGSKNCLTATGFLSAMVWRSRRKEVFDGLSNRFIMIDSPMSLRSSPLETIILPGSCHYLSTRMFEEIFHMGHATEIVALLYPGERCSSRKRLSLPPCLLFKNRSNHEPTAFSLKNDLPSHPIGDTDQLAKDLIWDVAHGGERSPNPGLVEVRYLLLEDERGFFVRSGLNSVLIYRKSSRNEPILIAASVDDISEGDWLIVKSDATDRLTELFSSRAGFDRIYADACDWKPALERYLLENSPEDLAEIMRAKGADGLALASSIRNWVEGNTYGPGHHKNLEILLAVLIETNCLDQPENFEAFVSKHWDDLRKLRGIGHHAEAAAHAHLIERIRSAIKESDWTPGNDGHMDLHIGSGIDVRLLRIAAIDDRNAWVPPESIGQLRPMRGR